MNRRARRNHTPAFKAKVALAAVNLGRTLVDDLLALKIQDRCETALSFPL